MYYATRGVQIAFRAKLETKRIIIYKLHDEINYFPERKIMCQDLIWPPSFNCKIKFSISLIFHKENTKEINAQSIRKLNKCNFQWTKTLYQRKFLMRARQNKCPISQNDTLHMKLSEFYLTQVFHNSCEIWHSFSRAPMRNSLWYVLLQLANYIYSPWKM